MADAPLKRDEQIELMRTAKERHEQHVARWKADPQVQDVLRMPPPPRRGGRPGRSRRTATRAR